MSILSTAALTPYAESAKVDEPSPSAKHSGNEIAFAQRTPKRMVDDSDSFPEEADRSRTTEAAAGKCTRRPSTDSTASTSPHRPRRRDSRRIPRGEAARAEWFRPSNGGTDLARRRTIGCPGVPDLGSGDRRNPSLVRRVTADNPDAPLTKELPAIKDCRDSPSDKICEDYSSVPLIRKKDILTSRRRAFSRLLRAKVR